MTYDRPNFILIQLAIWAVFSGFLVLYALHKWPESEFALINAGISLLTYAAAVYGNVLWLMPRFFRRKNLVTYLGWAVLFLVLLIALRLGAERLVLFPLHLKFFDLSLSHFAFGFMTTTLAFLFGGLMYISMDYFQLLQRQEALKRRQATAELSLLKSQVQPHFLFNTLNNLYYLAFTKSDQTPQVIAKLSEIMRYFVDEAPQERVPLETEVAFLRNYIALEGLRMVHPLKLDFRTDIPGPDRRLPPMLLIPLVENVFKHGVDKTRPENEACLELEVCGDRLSFRVRNRIFRPAGPGRAGGGIDNLRQRLTLLFGENYSLNLESDPDSFTAHLQFPLTP